MVCAYFEGVEKSLEVTFALPAGNSRGARAIPRDQIDYLLNCAACTIIGTSSTETFDSYVLSESSLFVYADQVIVKTCGTTKLLHLLRPLLEIAESLLMTTLLVVYRRKNFGFPSEQLHPHTGFDDEKDFLNDIVPGESFLFSALGGDEWYMFVADCTTGDASERRARVEAASAAAAPSTVALPLPSTCMHVATRGHAVLELMMHDLDAAAMSRFYRAPEYAEAADMTAATGIGALLAGTHIDAHMFTPCGYSCNALRDDRYWTIHVTPEPACSYVSFETNCVPEDWPLLIEEVCRVFRPSRAVITVRAAADMLSTDSVDALDLLEHGLLVDRADLRVFRESAVAVWFCQPVPSAPTPAPPHAIAALPVARPRRVRRRRSHPRRRSATVF